MRNILGYDIPISDLPFLKVRKGKSQKPKEDPVPATRKGKENVPEGPKKSKEHEKAPKTVKKLLADAQRIGAEQEATMKGLSWVKSLRGSLLRKNQGLRRHGCISNQLVRQLRVFPFAPNPCR
jgi:hypothetical protein